MNFLSLNSWSLLFKGLYDLHCSYVPTSISSLRVLLSSTIYYLVMFLLCLSLPSRWDLDPICRSSHSITFSLFFLCFPFHEEMNYRMYHVSHRKTRPDTRPPVADGWAGAEMRVFPRFNSSVTDRPTDRPTNRPTDGRTKPLIELRVRN